MKSVNRPSRIAILAAIGGLIIAALGCNLPAEELFRTPTPATISTPTPVASTTPLPDEVAPANELEAQVEDVYRQNGSAVVNVTSVSYAYDFFFNPVPQEGTGSGFIYDSEGHVVTNYHVVEDAEELSVTLADGEVYQAEIIGSDPSNDLAVLRILRPDSDESLLYELPDPIPLGRSDHLRVGQFVVAIGNPFGLERTLTVGVISSLGRVIESPDGRFIGEVIQIYWT